MEQPNLNPSEPVVERPVETPDEQEGEHFGQDDASRLINRLRRVEGQSRGLQRMIEEGRPCEEIFTQLSATKAALDRVGILLISLKMRECLMGDVQGLATQEAVEKALDAFLKYSRCIREG
jgi:CsoR family transcriptional regulator, copper-sensing transcriptional repressor